MFATPYSPMPQHAHQHRRSAPCMGPLLQPWLLVAPVSSALTACASAPQPRAARRGICGTMGTSVSGAMPAVLLPVLSRASTLSPWCAPCSVWKAAMHTALLVSWLPLGCWVGLQEGASLSRFILVLSRGIRSPSATLRSGSRCGFLRARPAVSVQCFWMPTGDVYHLEHGLIELSAMMGKF